MKGRLWYALASLVLTVHLTGCQSWRAERVSPSQLIMAEHPTTRRVTRPEGPQLLLRQPTARNHSIFGVTEEHVETGLHLHDVSKVEARRFNAARTGGLVLGVAGGAVAVVYGIAVIGCATHNCGL